MVAPFYRNIRLLILSMVMILCWGGFAFQALPRQEDPTLVARTAVVQTRFPGASAERVEALVTEVIESELSEIEEINTLTSDSRVGFSTVLIELQDSVKEAQPIWSRVRDEIDTAAQQFPPGALDPELEEAEVRAFALIPALVWTGVQEPNYGILRRFAEELQVELRGVPGTEDVELFGAPDEEIRVEIDPSDLAAVGLNATQLAQRIDLSDAKVSAGQFRSSTNRLAIELESELDSLERIRQIPIRSTLDGQFTRLGDMAQVSRSVTQPLTDTALIEGRTGIALGVLMEQGLRIDQWVMSIHQRLEQFRDRLPSGVELKVIFDQSQYVEARLDSLISNLFFGAGLVILVTFVGMGWRSSLVVGIALPLTVCAVLGQMQFLNIPVHQMSVTGLIIALGLLIDNAIIVVDEIQVELKQGLSPMTAVTKAVAYLKIPLFASTLTTVATFLPIVLLPGAAGEFVGSIAMTVILSLISSFLISLTVIAALAGRMLGQTAGRSDPHDRIRRHGIREAIVNALTRPGAWWNDGLTSPVLGYLYRQSLGAMTARPLIAVGLCLVIPIAGIAAAGTLEEQFFPSVDRDQFQIEVEFAAHRAIEETRADVLQMRDFLKQNPQVLEVHWFVGESAPKFFYNFTGSLENSPYYAQALVQLTSERNIRSLIRSLQADLSRSFPDARILVRQLEQGPPFEAPVEFRIYGPDVEELRRLGAEVRRILAGVAEVVHVRDDLTETLPKLGLLVDEEQAVQAGLTNTDIAQQLQTTLEGAVGGSILESVENLPIRVRVADADRANLAEIASLDLISTQDQDLEARSLTALGQFELVPQLSQIARRNEQRVNTVQGFINAGVLPSTVLSDFQRALEAADFQLPPGYRSELGGEYAERNEAVGNLVAYVGLLMLVMVTALVLSLGSFRQTGIVAIVAIGSVGMALFSLWAFEVVFGFMAVVGTMGLIGIAINGSIIVLSALNEDERAQQGDQVAIQAVVVKATRHVLTTTVTTMVGFIPLLISGGDFWEPLSVAIAGGIGGSPLLALYMTPAAYLLIKGKRRRTHRSILVSPPVQVHPEVVKH